LTVDTETGRIAPELEPEELEDDSSPEAPPRKRRRGRFACFVFAVLGLAGVLGGWFGNLWIAFDVFAQFSYQFWLVAIAFGIAFFMPFARVLTGIAITVIGLLVIGIMPHLTAASYPAPEVKPPAEHRVLRVMSFNTWLENADVDAIAAEVQRNDPDILVLLEFGNEKGALLDKLKPQWPYQDDCRHLDHCYMAVVSKFPIADFESHASWVGPPMVRASFGKELGGLTVIGTHTIRFPYMRAQLTQLNELADLIRKLEGPRVVMGDFNATPSSRLLSTFEQRSTLRRLDGWLPTWPANFQMPQLAIDHIFASPEVKGLEKVRIGNGAGSDHYPLVVRVAVPVTP